MYDFIVKTLTGNKEKAKEYSLEQDIEQLYAELRTINRDKEIINTEWWAGYKDRFEKAAQVYKDQGFNLCNNPVKHEKEIMYKYVLHQVAIRMIRAVELSIQHADKVLSEIKHKEGMTHQRTP